MELTVTIAKSFPELEYTIHCLLGEFLGLEYILKVDSSITNPLFSHGEKYLTIVSKYSNFFPGDGFSNVDFGNISIGKEKYEIVSIFGKSEIGFSNDSYVLKSDILGSTFFMLSRWEEKDNQQRDKHSRFPATESLAYRRGFLYRPIVNEYIELLWGILVALGIEQKRKEWKFNCVPTHDVDRPYFFNGLLQTVRHYGGWVKRARIREMFQGTLASLMKKDPWDTYDLMMDLSEKRGVKSNFFFIAGGQHKLDADYNINDTRIVKLIKHIQNRDHLIGLHPSYDAYNNKDQFRKEKEALEKVANQSIKSGRQHYLRFENPKTWQIWEANNMKWDSTLSYADCSGFRCGVCYPFPVFDIENRAQLKLKERPLIVMEASILHYQNLSTDQAISFIEKLKNEVKKYNGEFVFLHHNSSFFTDEYLNGKSILESFYN